MGPGQRRTLPPTATPPTQTRASYHWKPLRPPEKRAHGPQRVRARQSSRCSIVEQCMASQRRRDSARTPNFRGFAEYGAKTFYKISRLRERVGRRQQSQWSGRWCSLWGFMRFPCAGLTRELVFPCLSPYFERAEKARGLVTPCRVTFERRTFEST